MKPDLLSPIPITKNCVLGLHLDIENEREHVLIGEMDEIQKKLAGEEAILLTDETRPFGTFIMECSEPQRFTMETLRKNLSARIQKMSLDFETSRGNLESYYQDENLCLQFMALRMWQEFRACYKESRTFLSALKGQKEIDKLEQALLDFLEEFTHPLRHSLENDIVQWQKETPKEPLQNAGVEYRTLPMVVWCDHTPAATEYIVISDSLMPAIFYYLKKIYSTGKYFMQCGYCQRFFLAQSPKRNTLCSDKCRSKRKVHSKKSYDAKVTNTEYEKKAKNAYAYWYNKIHRMKVEEYSTEDITVIQKQYSDFCAQLKQKKKEVKTGKLSPNIFENWLYSQTAIIESFVVNKGFKVQSQPGQSKTLIDNQSKSL